MEEKGQGEGCEYILLDVHRALIWSWEWIREGSMGEGVLICTF